MRVLYDLRIPAVAALSVFSDDVDRFRRKRDNHRAPPLDAEVVQGLPGEDG